MVCKQYGIPYCTHSLNAPCPYIKHWSEDGSLEPKRVANDVLMTIYALCLTEYEGVSKIFRTGAAIYTAVVVVDGRTTMSSESVCQVTRSWVDVGSFHMRLVVRFMIFTASVRNILDTRS
jgi:hypothetical protein